RSMASGLPVLLIGLPLPLLLLEPPELEIPFVLSHGIEETLCLVPVEAPGPSHPTVPELLGFGRSPIRDVRPFPRIHPPILLGSLPLLCLGTAIGLPCIRTTLRTGVASLRSAVTGLTAIALPTVRPAVLGASIRPPTVGATVAGL